MAADPSAGNHRDPTLGGAAALVAIQGLIAVVGVYFVNAFVGLQTPGCSPTCDWTLLNRTNDFYRWVVGLIFAVTAVAVFLLWKAERPRRWVALLGIGLTFAASIAGVLIGQIAVAP